MTPSKTLQSLIHSLETQQEMGLLPDFLIVEKEKGRSQPEKKTPKLAQPAQNIPVSASSSSLEEVRAKIGNCTRCRLHQGRTHIVFGVGNPQADLMFVGEAPGRDEDLKAEPFVGRAGQLLTKIIQAMGYERSDIYIANVVKCRPPENRNPAPDEIETCSPFLFEQIQMIQPKVIVCLGNFAVQTLLATEEKITNLRGRFHLWPNAIAQSRLNIQLPLESIKLMPTYHPAFLLRNPAMKKPVWEDMQLVMKELKN